MVAVVHLVWGPLGSEPVERFVRSYRRHEAGVAHELVILLNGVEAPMRRELDAVLDGIPHRRLELERPVQDLLAYRQAAERLEHDRVCFLNSYSEILAPLWLASMESALAHRAAGIAAATGSWASMSSLAMCALGLPSPYRRAIPDRRLLLEHSQAMQQELAAEGGRESAARPPRGLRGAALALANAAIQARRFPRFPAAHVRTNAFILARELLLALPIGPLSHKADAYELESGRRGITRRLRALGLHPWVVDRDGGAHPPDRWPESATFWQGDQEGLLIADNQTRLYASGELHRRRVLAALAWGERGRPLPARLR